MPPLPDCGLIARGKVIATARIRCASGFSRSSLMLTMRREPERN
jgi:hypothetical protein